MRRPRRSDYLAARRFAAPRIASLALSHEPARHRHAGNGSAAVRPFGLEPLLATPRCQTGPGRRSEPPGRVLHGIAESRLAGLLVLARCRHHPHRERSRRRNLPFWLGHRAGMTQRIPGGTPGCGIARSWPVPATERKPGRLGPSGSVEAIPEAIGRADDEAGNGRCPAGSRAVCWARAGSARHDCSSGRRQGPRCGCS